jgi:putative redox protein
VPCEVAEKTLSKREKKMSTEIQVHAVREGGMRFTATVGGHTVTLDYPLPPKETCSNPTPLQMLLTSLAVCSGSSVALVLERMRQRLTGLEVEAHALRAEEHPTVLTEIDLVFVVRGVGVEADAVERALRIAEAQLCPVWVMLKDSTPISASYRLVDE